MKKNNIKTRVIGTVLATICALSAGAAITAVSANAAAAPATVSAVKAKACKMTFKGGTSYGYDWDYRADSTAAKISCTYDFKTKTYTYRAVGQYAGVTNAVIKYATPDGKWHNVPVRFTVDKGLNVTGQQTGREFVTNNRYA